MMDIRPPDFKYCPFCGRPLGVRVEENKERKYCDQCQWTHYPHVAASVTGIVVRGRKVLLVKRARDPFRGTWMCPSGFVDFGEHPEETLARELREETGLEVVRCELIGVFQSEDDPRELGHFVLFYRAETSGDFISTDPHENESVRWFDLHDLPPVAWKLQRRFLTEFQQHAGLA
jgi:ADP-ribose pyrophosphatase YjhB (NUDIX family)